MSGREGAREQRGRLGEFQSTGNGLFFPPSENICVYCFSLNSLDSLTYDSFHNKQKCEELKKWRCIYNNSSRDWRRGRELQEEAADAMENKGNTAPRSSKVSVHRTWRSRETCFLHVSESEKRWVSGICADGKLCMFSLWWCLISSWRTYL